MNEWTPRRCSPEYFESRAKEMLLLRQEPFQRPCTESDLDAHQEARLPHPWMEEQGRWSMWDEKAQAPIRYQRLPDHIARRRARQFGSFVTAAIVIYVVLCLFGGPLPP